eukprot:363901-Chlamydomonas_euryale.AAC.16
MPRVANRGAKAPPKDRLDRCLEALLQSPDAACLDGGEMCCGGCDDGSQLVAGLAAFVSHSAPAARRFVARGGLEAIESLVRKPLRGGESQAGPGPGSTTYQDAPDDDDDGDDGWGRLSDVSRAMGALAILQALTESPHGQNLVLQRRPELLQMVSLPQFAALHLDKFACVCAALASLMHAPV